VVREQPPHPGPGPPGWFPVVTAGLAGNAVTDSLPGGAATGAAVQFGMLTTAGFDTGTATDGLSTSAR